MPVSLSFFFNQDGFLNGQQAELVQNKILSLFAEIRPNAVALVDSFDYPDQILQSCIGRYDGNVYEALYEYAKNSPLNKQDVSHWCIMLYLKFVISSSVSKKKLSYSSELWDLRCCRPTKTLM